MRTELSTRAAIGGELACLRHLALEPIAAEWDRFVPRDVPHLRAGFLRAAHQGGLIQTPAYLLVYSGSRLVAVAVVYTLMISAPQAEPSATPGRRPWLDWLRRRFAGPRERPLRVCGSPVGNAESGVWFDPSLSPEVRRRVFRLLSEEVLRGSRMKETIFFKDFTEEAVREYAGELESQGYFTVNPGPGTRLDLPFASFDEYLAAMQKRYRARVRKDLKTAEELDFTLLDSFAELAPTAARLYRDVVAHAEFTLQTADERFFAAVSDFEQAGLLVARHRATGDVLGVNLLLFGDTCMHNVYIGFDYASNEQHHTYFALVEHSIRLAIERRCRVAYLGQASYEFKARLGAVPYPLVAYMKHRVPPVHWMLRASRDKFFPKSDVATHDVFRNGQREE